MFGTQKQKKRAGSEPALGIARLSSLIHGRFEGDALVILARRSERMKSHKTKLLNDGVFVRPGFQGTG